jgi:Flp pilus assembly protein TadD
VKPPRDQLAEVLRTAEQLLEAGHYRAVLAVTSRALVDHGDWPALHVRRARALLALHRAPEAELDLALAVRLDPHCAAAYRLLCEIALCRGDLTAAEELLDRALALEPRHPRAQELVDVVLGWRSEIAARAYRRRRAS